MSTSSLLDALQTGARALLAASGILAIFGQPLAWPETAMPGAR
jgi:hypothetical protein